jgi:Transglycosylase SLT domain
LLFCWEDQQETSMPITATTDPTRLSQTPVTAAIASAAAKTGMDFNYLMGQARIESGLNPNAQAKTSSASGLFQFTKQTWLATVKAHGADHGLGLAAAAITQNAGGRYSVSDPAQRDTILNMRFAPEAASAMAAEFASDNADYLNGELGRAPEQVDLYLAHFLGAAGAARFLKSYQANPDGAAAPELPKAAAANRSVFYAASGAHRSFAEIRQRFAAKLGNAGTPTPAAPPPTRPYSIARKTPERFSEFPSMRVIEPMPHHLSLDFAHAAYGKLAAMGAKA